MSLIGELASPTANEFAHFLNVRLLRMLCMLSKLNEALNHDFKIGQLEPNFKVADSPLAIGLKP